MSSHRTSHQSPRISSTILSSRPSPPPDNAGAYQPSSSIPPVLEETDGNPAATTSSSSAPVVRDFASQHREHTSPRELSRQKSRDRLRHRGSFNPQHSSNSNISSASNAAQGKTSRSRSIHERSTKDTLRPADADAMAPRGTRTHVRTSSSPLGRRVEAHGSREHHQGPRRQESAKRRRQNRTSHSKHASPDLYFVYPEPSRTLPVGMGHAANEEERFERDRRQRKSDPGYLPRAPCPHAPKFATTVRWKCSVCGVVN